jgi:Trp operon repressor
LLKNFSQGDEKLMMTIISRHAIEDEGEYQSKERLEEARIELVEELVEGKLSEKEVEKQLNDRIAELESTTK